MPHATLKIKPGVNTNETPVLNEAGVSACNLIRFKFDPQGIGLVEKLGGWSKFKLDPFSTVVRHLYAWQDISNDKFVVAGMQGTGGLFLMKAKQLPSGNYVDDPGAVLSPNITPLFNFSDAAPTFATTAGSPIVSITDATMTNAIHITDAVYIATHVAIGGIVLFGQYPVYSVASTTQFSIMSLTLLGLPNPALSSSTTAVLPSFTTVLNDFVITVTLPKHGYIVGSYFPLLIPVTVGGVTLQISSYPVQKVIDVDNFTVYAQNVATSVATVTLNSNHVRMIYNVGGIPITTQSGYGTPIAPTPGFGYGKPDVLTAGFGYGLGGAVPAIPGTPAFANDWAFDNWGSTLLASPEGTMIDSIPVSGIYAWTPDQGTTVVALIPEAPPVNDGFFVAMPQRQIITWGSSFDGVQDPLLIRWCDVNDYTTWVATITNQAGSYRVPKGSKIVGCIQGPQQGIIFTDLAVWAMQYVSQPYIYSFNEIGNGCGLIAQKAATSLNGTVYWMSQRQFFQLSGGGVAPIPCPVWDVVFQNMDQTKLDNIRIAPNPMFNEISWFYTSISSSDHENDSYVKFNYVLNVWDYGSMPRSAWITQSVVGPPLAAGADPVSKQNYVYQHEVSPDADGQVLAAWATTGFFALSDGDTKVFVDEIWPDMKWGPYGGSLNATVSFTFGGADFPSQAPIQFGPFSFTSSDTYTTPRLRARLLQVTISSSDRGSFWRLGGMRYRMAPDGKY